MTGIGGEKRNTRFLATLEIEVVSSKAAIYPSLRFGMTSFLRWLCLKVASAFTVPEPNDVVILPVPPYAGSRRQRESSRLMNKDLRRIEG